MSNYELKRIYYHFHWALSEEAYGKIYPRLKVIWKELIFNILWLEIINLENIAASRLLYIQWT